MSDELTITYMRLDEVARWPRNVKRHDIGALVESIRRYGFVDPPKYDHTLGALVYGNGRDEALEWMHAQGDEPPRGVKVDTDGMWLMPVKVGIDAPSEAEAEALALDHNNLTMAGGDFTAWDMSKLWGEGYTDILAGLATSSALPITVDGDALDGLLAAMEPTPEAQPGDDDAPSPDTPTRCQPGDVWRVGEHTVCCLDSTDRALVERWATGITFVVADPPYGVNCVENSPRMQELGYKQFDGDATTDTAREAFSACYGIAPVQVWWGANYYADTLPPSPCWIVWDKDHHGMDFADAELAWASVGSPVRCFRHAWSGADRDSEKGEARTHPNQKPVALFLWLYERYGKPGDLIFDPFLGSGPSLKAAHRMGDRTVVGFELSPHYIDHIIEWAESNGLHCERAE
jgi:hypothetical protein